MNNMKKLLAVINVLGFSVITCSNVVACSCSSNTSINYLQQSFSTDNKLDFSDSSLARFGLTLKDSDTGSYSFDWSVVTNITLQSVVKPTGATAPVQLIAKADSNDYPSIDVKASGERVAAISCNQQEATFVAENNMVVVPLILNLFVSDGTEWVSQEETMNINVDVLISDVGTSISLNDLAIGALELEANGQQTYGDLNKNQTIIDEVIDAFHQLRNKNQPTINVDFTISNDKNPTDLQAANTAVVITVSAVATSKIITPDSQTTFIVSLIDTVNTIDLADISINNIDLEVNTHQTYGVLNSNAAIIKTIINTITSYQPTANAQVNVDFTLTNDKNPNYLQVANTTVTITVSTTNTSTILIPGSQTTFTVTLIPTSSTVNLNNIVVTDPIITANPGNDYTKLNSNQYIIQSVIDGVNLYRAKTNPKINIDFTITNDQVETDKQSSGTSVTFTATATNDSRLLTPNSQITFTFVLIDSVNLFHVRVVGIPYVAAKPTQTYQQLNDNHTIIDAVIQAMKETKTGVAPIENKDFIIINDQDDSAMQVSKTKVKFTVITKEGSHLLMADTEFSFILTLG